MTAPEIADVEGDLWKWKAKGHAQNMQMPNQCKRWCNIVILHEAKALNLREQLLTTYTKNCTFMYNLISVYQTRRSISSLRARDSLRNIIPKSKHHFGHTWI